MPNSTRAYTAIDAATTRVGNAWIERTWSAFPGRTMGLIERPGNFEWTTREGPEIRIEAGGEALGVLELGETEWSEHFTPFGAVLRASHEGGKLNYFIDTCAFHDAPALLRSATITNKSRAEITVARPALDVLPLHRDETSVWVWQFQNEKTAIRWETEEPAAAVAWREQGLILGIDGGGIFALFEPNPAFCTLGLDESRTLRSGESWQLPDTYILAFTGSVGDAARLSYPDFLLLLRKMRRWADEREAAEKPTGEPE